MSWQVGTNDFNPAEKMSYYVSQVKRKDDHYICEESTRNVCTKQCPDVHHSFPFLWQVLHTEAGWLSMKQGEHVEKKYSNPANQEAPVEVSNMGLITGNEQPLYTVI